MAARRQAAYHSQSSGQLSRGALDGCGEAAFQYRPQARTRVDATPRVTLSSDFATRQVSGWNPGLCDVLVSWSGPGPNRSELREFCAHVARVRFVILQGDLGDFGKREAAVRFGSVQEAKRATKELDRSRCKCRSFPQGTLLSVRWALAEQAWGGRPPWDSLKADTNWHFAEAQPRSTDYNRKTMEAWRTEAQSEEPVRRHGVPGTDWYHDMVSRVSLRNEFAPDFYQVMAEGRPVPIAPQGHPRLRPTDGGHVSNLPYDSRGRMR